MIMEPKEKVFNKANVAITLVILFLLFISIFAILKLSKPEPVDKPFGQSSQNIAAPLEKDKTIAETYLEAIIKQAFQQGTNAALKEVLRFAQTEAKDGQPSQPLCDEINIGPVHLVNVACLKKAEAPATPAPTP